MRGTDWRGADEPLQTRKERHGRVREKLIFTFELDERRMPDRNAKVWKLEGEKKRVARKRCKSCGKNFKLEHSWSTKVCGTLPKRGWWKTEERWLNKRET